MENKIEFNITLHFKDFSRGTVWVLRHRRQNQFMMLYLFILFFVIFNIASRFELPVWIGIVTALLGIILVQLLLIISATIKAKPLKIGFDEKNYIVNRDGMNINIAKDTITAIQFTKKDLILKSTAFKLPAIIPVTKEQRIELSEFFQENNFPSM